MKRVLAFLLVMSDASTGWADAAFYVAPNSRPEYSVTGDAPRQTGVGSCAAWDLEVASDPLFVGTYAVDQGNPLFGNPEVFAGASSRATNGVVGGTAEASTPVAGRWAFELGRPQVGAPVSTVPVPAAILLVALGTILVGWLRWRKVL